MFMKNLPVQRITFKMDFTLIVEKTFEINLDKFISFMFFSIDFVDHSVGFVHYRKICFVMFMKRFEK